MSKSTANARAEVLYLEPNAWEYDDGEWVYIYVANEITETCSECKRAWTHRPHRTNTPAIGSGNSSEAAWRNALRTLTQREVSREQINC